MSIRLGREQRDGYLLSAMEGLFFMPVPDNPAGEWTTSRIADGEYSDAFAFDWDDDGEPEIFTISPFHGHVLSIHRREGAAAGALSVRKPRRPPAFRPLHYARVSRRQRSSSCSSVASMSLLRIR